MKSFSVLFVGFALGEDFCSDGTCAQDEATLLQLQGLKQKIQTHQHAAKSKSGGSPSWNQFAPDRSKCNNNVGFLYVGSQGECEAHAMANGHPYYSFRHNAESQGHKCFSSSHCDDGLIGDRTNEWKIYQKPPSCPAGWAQVGDLGADISGCGLTTCDGRYDIDNEEDCAARCASMSDCKAFNFAPRGADRNHEDQTACGVYNSDTPNAMWTGTLNGAPAGLIHVQVFCKPDDGENAYVGCYVDDGNRDFDTPSTGFADRAQTSTSGYQECKAACGTPYFSLQYGGECFCSDTAPDYEQRDDSECAMDYDNCLDNSFNCGDSWRNAVYRVPPAGESSFVGCFKDDGSRDFDTPSTGFASRDNTNSNSFAKCSEACAGSAFISLQYGGECFCSDTYPDYEKRPDSECAMNHGNCLDDSFNCGDSWRNAVYVNPRAVQLRYANPTYVADGLCVSLSKNSASSAGCDETSCSGNGNSDATLQVCDANDLGQTFTFNAGRLQSRLGHNRCLHVGVSSNHGACEPFTLEECSDDDRQQFTQETAGASTVWRNTATSLAIDSDSWRNTVDNWIWACPGTNTAKHFDAQ